MRILIPFIHEHTTYIHSLNLTHVSLNRYGHNVIQSKGAAMRRQTRMENTLTARVREA
jgi:hypothetical protein